MVEASKDKVSEETIKDVESALRTLFRELSGGGAGRHYRYNERFRGGPPCGTGKGAGGAVCLGGD